MSLTEKLDVRGILISSNLLFDRTNMRKDYMKKERNLDQSNGIVYITAIPRNMTIFVMGLYFLYFIESVYHIVSKLFLFTA